MCEDNFTNGQKFDIMDITQLNKVYMSIEASLAPKERKVPPTITYEVDMRDSFPQLAVRLIALAREKNARVQTRFNGVDILVTQNSKPQEVVDDFHRKAERKEHKGKAPRDARFALRREMRLQELQRNAPVLMDELANLDFHKQAEVLNWIYKFQPVSEHSDVIKDNGKVFKVFTAHGYLPNVNVGSEFNAEDPDNFARYIVGQVLQELRTEPGQINSHLLGYIEMWREKFAN